MKRLTLTTETKNKAVFTLLGAIVATYVLFAILVATRIIK